MWAIGDWVGTAYGVGQLVARRGHDWLIRYEDGSREWRWLV